MKNQLLMLSMPNNGSDWLVKTITNSQDGCKYFREFFNPGTNPKYSDALGEEFGCEYITFYNDYPEAVSNNAKKGIELNQKYGNKCATRVGRLRATTLANRQTVSVAVIKRMYSYLSRAEEYYNADDESACGTISYLLWGGLAAKRWSEAKLKELGIFEQ